MLRLGAGFTIGLILRLPGRATPAICLYYGLLLVVMGVVWDQAVALIAATTAWAIVVVLVSSAVGRWLRLTGLSTPRDVLRLLAVGLVAAALVVPAELVHDSDGRIFGSLLAAPVIFSLGVFLSVITGGAMILAYTPGRLRKDAARGVAGLLGLTALTLVLLVAINLDLGTVTSGIQLFLLIVVLGLLAIRYGPLWTSLALTSAATSIMFGVVHGQGVFFALTRDLPDTIVSAQFYVVVLSTGGLMLSVYAAHSRAQAAAARRSANMLRDALLGADAQWFLKRLEPDGRRVYTQVNTALAKAMQLPAADIIGRTSDALFPPDVAQMFAAREDRVLDSGVPLRSDNSLMVGGRHRSYLTTIFPIRDQDDDIVGIGGVSIDRTAEKRRERLLQLVFDQSPVPTARLSWREDGAGEVLEANDTFARLLGAPLARLLGTPLDDYLLPGQQLPIADGGGPRHREVGLRRSDGSDLTVMATTTVVRDPGLDEEFVLVILEDVTAVRAAEARLVHRATHDPLTDLLNRDGLVERMGAQTRAGAVVKGTVVLCCDLDGFKQINDTLGHAAGDRVLLGMADRLRSIVHSDDIVGRMGADAFVVVCGHAARDGSEGPCGALIRENLERPFDLDGQTHVVGVSVGTAHADGQADPEELLRRADVALTLAKEAGRRRVAPYRPDLDRQVHSRLAMRETLRRALFENRIEVHVQPIIDLRTGRMASAEA